MHKKSATMDPSHCGIPGNQQADKMAKMDAKDKQEDNLVSLTELKTIIKNIHKTPKPHDSYYHLTRPEQVIIFCLRT